MTLRADLPTFAGGEISPDLAARFDTAKYKTALRKSRNMLSLTGGGAYKRPPLRFAGEVADSSKAVRQVPFQFSLSQGYSLIFGELTMRVAFDGGFVLDTELIVAGITNAAHASVNIVAHGYVVGDDIAFSGIGGMAEINGRLARVLSVTDADNVVIDLDTTAFGVFTGSTGGIAGNAMGSTGGHAPPPPAPAAGAVLPPTAPFPPFVLPPDFLAGLHLGGWGGLI